MVDVAPKAVESRETGARLPRRPPPRTIRQICAELSEVMVSEGDQSEVQLESDPRRDALLGEYRRALLALIREDARVNVVEVDALMRAVTRGGRLDPAATPLGADLLSRLEASLNTVNRLDPYADGQTEFTWWLALTQFYLDGLFLADCLLGTERGRFSRCWRRPGRRTEFLGFSTYGRLEALVGALETAVPDVFRVNPVRTYLPLLLFLAAHHVFPSKRFCVGELLASSRGWVRGHGLARMCGRRGDVVRYRGMEHLHDEALFDRATGQTRHNVIIVSSHRLGYLDWPLFYEPLRRMRFGLWMNNAFYGPAVERKLAADRFAVPVAGRRVPPLAQSMARTADLLVEARVPVVIIVDGRQPSPFYGQQMRVKTGVRLAVNEAIRRSAGTDRRTYVLPLSLNDPVGYLQGRQDTITVRCHPPIRVDGVLEREPAGLGLSGERNDAQRGARCHGASGVEPRCHSDSGAPGEEPQSGERPDPLLNHLEALFLLETAHANLGLPRPRIVECGRWRRRNRHLEPLPKRGLHTTITDLAKHAAIAPA